MYNILVNRCDNFISYLVSISIMSAFNLSSICGICIFFIYVDGIPLNNISEHIQSYDATDLPLADHITEDSFLADEYPNSTPEENRLELKHEFVPRDLDDVFTDIPTEDFDPEVSRKKKIVKYVDSGDGVHIFSRDPSSEPSKLSAMNSVKSGRKFFLFDDGLPKPTINEDISEKLFLFKGMDHGVGSHNSYAGTKEGQKTHFLFDYNLPQMSFSNKSKSGDKFAVGFDY